MSKRPVPTPARTRAGGRRDWNERFEQMTTPAVASLRAAALSIGVIGAGKVGAVLAARLREAGHPITASPVSPTPPANARPPCCRGPGREAQHRRPRLRPAAAHRPRRHAPNVVRVLADSGALHEGQYVVHTSGRHGLAVLAPAAAVGARVIALHPAMTFTGTAVDLDRLDGSVFGLTADPAERAARRAARRRARRPPDLGARGDAHALPRGSRPRRQPPGHPRHRGDGAAHRRRLRRPGRHPAAAARGRARQRARAR